MSNIVATKSNVTTEPRMTKAMTVGHARDS
jgi:hypothetical protein